MEFSTQTTASLHQIKTAALAVGVFADGVLSPAADLIDRAANGAVRAVAKTEFRGRAGATLTLRNLPGVTAQRVVLVGLGKQDEYSARAHAAAEQAFAQPAWPRSWPKACRPWWPTRSPTCRHRSRPQRRHRRRRRHLSLRRQLRQARPRRPSQAQEDRPDRRTGGCHPGQKGLREGAAIANGMSLTRDLGNLPGNICTPTYLGETAKRLAREFKSLKVEVLDEAGRGPGHGLVPVRGPRLRRTAALHRAAPRRQAGQESAKAGDGPIVLVGKGITFDAGGIEPAATMDEMK